MELLLQSASDRTSEAGALEQLLSNLDVPAAGAVAGVILFVVAFLAVLAVGRLLVRPVVGRLLDSRDVDTHARRPLLKLTNFAVLFVAVAIAFGFAGFGSILTSLATIGAAATLAIGFAMQNVIANFVAGVFIFTEQPFQIGDWIEFDGNAGVVEDISLRVTRVRTFDNELLTVPNSKLADNVVKNPVAKETLRLKFLFGIGYDDDIEEATEIIVEEAESHPDVLDDPEPTVRLTELAGSSVGLQSRVWIVEPSRAEFVRIRGEYVTSVKRRFDEVGIDIPYPIRTLDGDIELSEVPAAEAADD
ncbi:mechanosensitive ion channel protein [Halobacteriales archaeon SW_7_71_33]|nr:MAG: mechanosensitive ion channel protein [Halobacteriales archaeon SW_7_71_33]